MSVNILAWALNQALSADQRSILTLMALLAAEANTGDTYQGNLPTLSACALMPLANVQQVLHRLQELSLVEPLACGYRLRAGVLVA